MKSSKFKKHLAKLVLALFMTSLLQGIFLSQPVGLEASSDIWSSPKSIAEGVQAKAAAANGKLHLVFRSGPQIGYSQIFYTTKKLGSPQWSPPILISGGDYVYGTPDIAVGFNDTVYVVYPRPNSIRYIKKPLNGTWSTPEDLPGTYGLDPQTPAILVDKFGVIHVLMAAKQAGYHQIYHTTSPDGITWSTLTNITSSPANSLSPAVTIDNENTLHAVWQTMAVAGDDIFYANKPPDGSWSTPVNVSNTRGYSLYPTLALDSSKTVHLVWREDELRLVYTNKPKGGAWSTPTYIPRGKVEGVLHITYPSLTFIESDGLNLVWQELRFNGKFDIFYSQKLNTTPWSTPIELSDISADSSKPHLVNDENDKLHLFWEDYVPATGIREITYRTTEVEILDNLSPTTTLSLTGALGLNNWYTSDVTVSLSAVDNPGGLGVKEIHYLIDIQETVVPGDFVAFALSTEGINEITYWAVDNAGNIEPQNTTIIKIDKTAPEINILSPVGTISIINPLVSVTINDQASGVAFYKYFFDSNEIPNTTTSLDLAYLSPGEHSFQVTVVDNAGNTATVSSIFTYSPTTFTLKSLLDRMYADGEITKLGTSLYDKLNDAQSYIDAGDYTNAKSKLNALVNQIEAQIDIHITADAGNILIADINHLITKLP